MKPGTYPSSGQPKYGFMMLWMDIESQSDVGLAIYVDCRGPRKEVSDSSRSLV